MLINDHFDGEKPNEAWVAARRQNMKKAMGIMGVLITVLLFTGCAEERHDEKTGSSEQQESTEDERAEALVLSEEDLARLQSVAEEYYTSKNRKMTSITLADPTSSFHRQDHEGYEPNEVALFEVFIENDEIRRYITIGSKDGWVNCSVLDEGY